MNIGSDEKAKERFEIEFSKFVQKHFKREDW
jgi:hypothetical protein